MKALLTLLTLTVSMNAFAGGSISREDALKEVCDESPNLCIVLQAVELEHSGNAVRARGGARMMPYEFIGHIGGYASWVVLSRDAKGHIELTIR